MERKGFFASIWFQISIFLIIPVVVVISLQVLNNKAQRRAEQIVVYIDDYYKSNNKLPDLENIKDTEIKFINFSSKVYVVKEGKAIDGFRVFYYILPMGPFKCYDSTKKGWSMLDSVI